MKRIPRLQVITDETVQSRWSHAQIAALAVAGGADGVQYREKRLRTTREMLAVARAVLAACGDRTVLVIDDRADVARSVGAPALHIGRNDIDVATARAIVGEQVVIGGTANSYEEAAGVWRSGVDYLGVGPVYGTRSKEQAAAMMGLETLRRICADSPVPVVAIGGITPERIPEVMACGTHGVAVLSAVLSAEDPVAATRCCVDALAAAIAARSA